MSWIWAALMPHPPILVPDIGRGREREAAATIDGVQRLTSRLQEGVHPDRILLLSPHQPYALGSLTVNQAPVVRGSFAPFGAPGIVFDLRTPLPEVDALCAHLEKSDFHVSLVKAHDLTRDQGSLVPLYFLEERFDGLPSVVLASPIGLAPEEALRLGRTLAGFDDGKHWGLLASGDLSHRLKPDAPAGFHPSGGKHDEAVLESLKRTDAAPLLETPPRVLEEAGECGLRSVLAMIGLCSALGGSIDVLSYEAPFGVGYCNALWMEAK